MHVDLGHTMYIAISSNNIISGSNGLKTSVRRPKFRNPSHFEPHPQIYENSPNSFTKPLPSIPDFSSFTNDQEIFPGFQEFTSNPNPLFSNDIQPQQPPPQPLSLIPPNPQTPVRPQFDHFLQGTPQSTTNTLEQTFGPQQPPSSFNNFVIHHRKEFVIPNDGR